MTGPAPRQRRPSIEDIRDDRVYDLVSMGRQARMHFSEAAQLAAAGDEAGAQGLQAAAAGVERQGWWQAVQRAARHPSAPAAHPPPRTPQEQRRRGFEALLASQFTRRLHDRGQPAFIRAHADRTVTVTS
ncbi:MAG: hypothetical protein GEV12_21845, partial [Micromonosporaceae bacterium]|nr:hypothetical protein [Micromonosporaceae bacterium]